ncbi:MAG: hypothetical protein ACJ735_11315 [Actinomycetes bacterium]
MPKKEPMRRDMDERDLTDQDPEEVLRRMLAISPEDAAEVREDAAEKAKKGEPDAR